MAIIRGDVFFTFLERDKVPSTSKRQMTSFNGREGHSFEVVDEGIEVGMTGLRTLAATMSVKLRQGTSKLPLNMPTTIYYNEIKRFLDETADNLGNLKASELEELYENLIKTVISILEQGGSSEIIEEIFAFCSASVLEMIQTAKGVLLKAFKERDSMKLYSNYHILISSIVSRVVKYPVSDFDENWIDLLLESVISGLTAIESETISLSGSSLIKLLKWGEEEEEDTLLCERLSKKLANHPDFVDILVADMCAMFSRIEEVGTSPFLRIVRFIELLINISDEKSGLENKIVETVEREFISKIYRTTLKTILSINLAFKWANELLKVCHRGNELVNGLVGEVFKELGNIRAEEKANFIIQQNSDFIEILANERSRKIPEIVKLLFTPEESEKVTLIVPVGDSVDGGVINDEIYKTVLLKQLESFEMFKVSEFHVMKSATPFSIKLFKSNRLVLLNWLPYLLKVVKIETKNVELRLQLEISMKLIEFLEL